MSLCVNLILEEEQRSGSKLNLKSVLRITSIVLPAMVLLLIAQQALRSFILNSQLNILESQWSAIEPRQKQAARLSSRLNFNITTQAELDAWEVAKPAWNEVLAAIMDAVPATIQLTTLRISLVEGSDSTATRPSPPERTYQILLDGTTRDVNSMAVVQTLERNLLHHTVIKPLVQSVSVANFAADLESGDVWSRVFTIEANLITLPAKEKR